MSDLYQENTLPTGNDLLRTKGYVQKTNNFFQGLATKRYCEAERLTYKLCSTYVTSDLRLNRGNQTLINNTDNAKQTQTGYSSVGSAYLPIFFVDPVANLLPALKRNFELNQTT